MTTIVSSSNNLGVISYQDMQIEELILLSRLGQAWLYHLTVFSSYRTMRKNVLGIYSCFYV